MSIAMNNMGLLLPSVPLPDKHLWATVTQASPLRIRVDGDSAPIPFTPGSLVQGLGLGDRVLIAFTTNDDPSFVGRRVTILGRSGGFAPYEPPAETSPVIAWRRRETNSSPATSGGSVEVGVLRLDSIPVVAGRGYWIYTPTMLCTCNALNVVALRLRTNTSGAATVSSSELRYVQTTIRSGTPDEPISIGEMYRPGVNGTLSVLLSVVNVSASGNAVLVGAANRAIELFVEDRGPIPAQTGTDL